MGRIMCTTTVYYKRIKENCRWNFRIKFALQGVVWRDWGGMYFGGSGWIFTFTPWKCFKNDQASDTKPVRVSCLSATYALCLLEKCFCLTQKFAHTSLLNIPFFGDFILPFNGFFFSKMSMKLKFYMAWFNDLLHYYQLWKAWRYTIT